MNINQKNSLYFKCLGVIIFIIIIIYSDNYNGLDPRSACVGFMVDEGALSKVFSEYMLLR